MTFYDFLYCLKSDILTFSEGIIILQKSLFSNAFRKGMKTFQAIKITMTF